MQRKVLKNISRRSAIKVISTLAGIAALAAMPSKWSKPVFQIGSLPVHAQTSGSSDVPEYEHEPVSYVLLPPPPASLLDSPDACFNGQNFRLSAGISPPQSGVFLHYVLAYVVTGPDGAISAPASTTGILPTDASGVAVLTVTVTPASSGSGTIGTLSVVWSFANPDEGSNMVEQDTDVEIGC